MTYHSDQYEFKPFNDAIELETHKGKFCPVCDKNWNHGHGHENCNTVPIEDGYLGLLIPIVIYLIYKIYKIKTR